MTSEEAGYLLCPAIGGRAAGVLLLKRAPVLPTINMQGQGEEMSHNCNIGPLNGACDDPEHWVTRTCDWCGKEYKHNPTYWAGGECDCLNTCRALCPETWGYCETPCQAIRGRE